MITRNTEHAASRLAERGARWLKGPNFNLDERIGGSALVSIVAVQAFSVLRGILRFPLRRQRPRIGAGVTIRNAGRLRFGAKVMIGPGAVIDALCDDGIHLDAFTVVGRNTRIEGTGSLERLGIGLRAGSRVGLGTDCLYGCAGGIKIGDNTIIGNYVSFHSENHVATDVRTPIQDQGVTRKGIVVGQDCWIGAKVTILDGARIGDGCIVAAGAVVTDGVYKPFSILGGVPARTISSRIGEASDRTTSLLGSGDD